MMSGNKMFHSSSLYTDKCGRVESICFTKIINEF